EAAASGMKAFDVILKVGVENIATVSDWDRAMRSNQGKTVAVTVLRDKKQQTLTLLVDSKKKGEVEFDGVFGDEDGSLLAFAGPEAAENLFADQSMADEMRKQAEQFRNQFNDQSFGIDPKHTDELTNQMQQWSHTFDPKTLGMDMD